jgi:hypothetical protein
MGHELPIGAGHRNEQTSGTPQVNAPHLVVLVRAGATFINGKLVERPAEDAPEAA